MIRQVATSLCQRLGFGSFPGEGTAINQGQVMEACRPELAMECMLELDRQTEGGEWLRGALECAVDAAFERFDGRLWRSHGDTMASRVASAEVFAALRVLARFERTYPPLLPFLPGEVYFTALTEAHRRATDCQVIYGHTLRR